MHKNTSPSPPVGVKKRHTFSGCWTCRKRKVKCDETRPSCLQCKKGNRPCGGYSADLVWVDPTDSKAYAPNGRRFLRTDLTWIGHKVLDPDDVDIILSQLDEYSIDDKNPSTTSPFQVFPVDDLSSIIPSQGHVGAQSPRDLTLKQVLPRPSRSLSQYAGMTQDDAYLLHHYSSHVATLMMPYEAKNNPWKIHYPAVAHEIPFLLQALLSHAALNLANLNASDHDLVLTAREKYASALSGLRQALSSRTDVGYSVILATILKLCMSEVYSGEPDGWANHLNGAWRLFLNEQDRRPWLKNDFAWACTQSLCLLKIVADTNSICHSFDPIEQRALRHVGMHNRDTDIPFGYTIGASADILLAISDIGTVSSKLRAGTSISSLNEEITAILQCLTEARQEAWSPKNGGTMNSGVAQQRQFVAAAEIYFQRTIFDAPPSLLRPQVTEVLDNVASFYEYNGGNLSIWPAFIAAVEAVDPSDLNRVQDWVEDAVTRGMGNRKSVKDIIDHVWKRRMSIAEITQCPLGEVRIDWRVIMHELNANVLLV